MLRADMGAFARLRTRRRLSGCVVFALLILGAMAAGHHHPLVGPDASAIAAPSAVTPMARMTECAICRAADPVRIVVADLVAPEVAVTTFVAPTVAEHALPASFRPCSPRAPPVAFA
jgi:hypothetical protein